MTKKSKTKSKVTTASASAIDSNSKKEAKAASNDAQTHLDNGTVTVDVDAPIAIPVINNGKISTSTAQHPPPTGYLTADPTTKLINASGVSSNNSNHTNNSSAPSLASIPGCVDDFLAPKFVKVLNLTENSYNNKKKGGGGGSGDPASSKEKDKTKSEDKSNTIVDSETIATSTTSKSESPSNANTNSNTTTTTERKNKRKKNKPVKNTITGTNLNVSYDSEDGRELDLLNSSGRNAVGTGVTFNGNGTASEYPTSLQNHLKSELTSKDVQSLAQLERIRSSACSVTGFPRSGNNIVLVSNEGDGTLYPQSSCYDDLGYDYDADNDELIPPVGGASGSASASASVPSDETSTVGFDHDEDDDEEREGSWSLTHNHNPTEYSNYPTLQHHASSSVASSESEQNISISTTASGSSSTLTSVTSSTKSRYPALATCSSIWDGANNPCEIKDCIKPANKKCCQCKTAFYCGEDHQRLDWKRHKNDCIPYRMERLANETDVSVAVAARNIPAGQLIFREKPLLVIPIADPENDFLNVMDLPCIQSRLKDYEGEMETCAATKPACFGCLKSVEFVGPPRYLCARCKLPLCSYKCHMDTFHQAAECSVLQSTGGWEEKGNGCYHSMYMDIEIVRALQLGNFDTASWDRFLQMKQNLRVEAYKASRKYHDFLENYRELVPISAKMSGYHDDLIGNVHAIITALSFRPSLKSTFKLIFTTQILFGHDCIPNTLHYLEESPDGLANRLTLVTKSSEPILKKAIITIDFSPTPFLYYPLRRMLLKNMLCIDDCGCRRCRYPSGIGDHTVDVKCPTCETGLVCPEKAFRWQNCVWSCQSCLEEFPYQRVQDITVECRDELAAVLQNPRAYLVPHLLQFISRREKNLNPQHSIILQAYSIIESQLRPSLAATRLGGPAPRYPESTLEEYRTLKKTCDVIERHLDIIRPGISYERGCVLSSRYYVEIAVSAKRYHLKLSSRKEYIQELMQSMKFLQEALKTFQVYEGYNRDVALHIQEATGALVTTKSFIQELLMTDNEESKTKKGKKSSGGSMT